MSDKENVPECAGNDSCQCPFCVAIRVNNITDQYEEIVIDELTEGMLRIKAAEKVAKDFGIDLKRPDIVKAIAEIMENTPLITAMIDSEGDVVTPPKQKEKILLH